MLFLKFTSILIILFCISCITKIELPVRQTSPYLVVEGTISTDPPPYTVKLSYSGKFSNTYQASRDTQQLFISDAKVSIKDDLGDSTQLGWVSDGTYQSSDSNFIGSVGRTYMLMIHLSNGKTYVSKPEIISAVAPIDSVTVVYDSTYITDVRPTQLIISVNTHDPPGIQNFYRWTSFGYIPRYSFGTFCCSLCEQLLADDQINILSDQFIDGHEIVQPVFYSPIYWFGIHYIEIKQYSVSKDVYLFWQSFLDQTNRTGSILDPLPASLIGNIYNAADSNDFALGYFETSDVYTKKVVIKLFFLQEYWLESIAGQYIKQGYCHDAYPNTLDNNAVPAGWENAEVIELH